MADSKEEKKYHRLVQTGVTLFLRHGDDYLFLKRADNKRVDPGKYNGVGGRVEPGEDYLSAAIRETEEETGYKVSAEDVTLAGVVKLEGGYKEDWVMCFFTIEVPTKDIPIGKDTDDGTLVWVNQDEVLDIGRELVDDINYVFKDIVDSSTTFFLTAQVNEDGIITQHSMSKLLDT